MPFTYTAFEQCGDPYERNLGKPLVIISSSRRDAVRGRRCTANSYGSQQWMWKSSE